MKYMAFGDDDDALFFFFDSLHSVYFKSIPNRSLEKFSVVLSFLFDAACTTKYISSPSRTKLT